MVSMPNALKGLVSKKKVRFQKDGFDLDLTYITPKIIAMGYPAQSWEGIYRNHIDDVVNFFKKRHEGHYQIYNLCNERHIDEQKFGRDSINHSYPFDDHNPPRFTQMLKCCDDIQNYLNQDPQNIVAVQCKAGKGRTGVIVCSYLIKEGHDKNATDALRFYGKSRTTNGKGVTIPSQIRYIYYFDHYVNNNLKYTETHLKLNYLLLEELPTITANGCEIQMKVDSYDQTNKLRKCQCSQFFEVRKDSQRCLKLFPDKEWVVAGDLKFQIIIKSKFGKRENLCHCWLNTFFVVNKPQIMFFDDKSIIANSDNYFNANKRTTKLNSDILDVSKQTDFNAQISPTSPTNIEKSYKLTLHKQEIDKANKDINNRTFPANFAMSFLFDHSSVSNRTDIVSSSNQLCPAWFVSKCSQHEKRIIEECDLSNIRKSPANSSRDDNSDLGDERSDSSESSTKQCPSDLD